MRVLDPKGKHASSVKIQERTGLREVDENSPVEQAGSAQNANRLQKGNAILVKRKAPTNVSEIKPSPKNPRIITDDELEALKRAMIEFGDLGGIVYNVRTQRLVGGHQRLKNLDPKWEIVKHPSKDKTGTIAEGYIITPFGRFNYREVDWNERKELAANVAANKISGDWDINQLRGVMSELVDLPEINLTGFSENEIESLVKDVPIELGFTETDAEESGLQGTVDNKNFVIYVSFSKRKRACDFLKRIGTKTELPVGKRTALVRGDELKRR